MRLFSSSSSFSLTKEQTSGRSNRVALFLNVYDLTPVNNYLYWFGLGIFHSGIEVCLIKPRGCCPFSLRIDLKNLVDNKSRILNDDTNSICGCKNKVAEPKLFFACGRFSREESSVVIDLAAGCTLRTFYHLREKSLFEFQLQHSPPDRHRELLRPGLGSYYTQPSGNPVEELNSKAHGLEYGFGAHEYPTSGVFEVEPRSCPGFIFRRSVLLGSTNMSRSEFRSFMEQISGKYHGDTYHLIAKNCNHFTEEVCLQLTGKPIPGWVNRLARLGSFCNCLLPESIQITAVRHLPDHPSYSGPENNEPVLPIHGENDCAEYFVDSDDDGPESVVSSLTAGSEDEEADHHLLTSPNSDVAFLKDKPVRLAKELL
ncbi:hypothetical protein Pint_15810 [Pistacia integerrima]|uniref:Uncharacterized protein n=1 Tax=Pistacia integerrima TaxID=434235 RepID=A0ACC0ZAV1_9ROSI|nr:hypothetical protein Pint_15810 [Pistacia integerrima]